MNRALRPIARRLARVPAKVGAFVRRSVETQIAVITLAICIPLLGPTVACNLTASQWGSIIAQGVTLACDDAEPYVPPSDKAAVTAVCKTAPVAAGIITSIIDAVAREQQQATPAAVQPQGEVAPRAVQCAGRNVAVMPAKMAWKAQEEMDKVKGCGK